MYPYKKCPPIKWKGIHLLPLLIAQGYGALLEKSTYSLLRVATVFLHLYYTVLDKRSYYNEFNDEISTLYK